MKPALWRMVERGRVARLATVDSQGRPAGKQQSGLAITTPDARFNGDSQTNILSAVVTVVLQIVLGLLLGFGGATFLGVGNGWELVVIPLGNVIGVWGVGVLAARLQGKIGSNRNVYRLAGSVIGSALGVVTILLTPATGFDQLLYPLIGAVLGYYLAALVRS